MESLQHSSPASYCGISTSSGQPYVSSIDCTLHVTIAKVLQTKLTNTIKNEIKWIDRYLSD